jgi:2-dehydropantoate 2-reductase
MNIAVVGLGGVGGYFGGKLARQHAGSQRHRVNFIARGAHLAAIREGGLQVEAVEGAFTARPDLATDRPADVGPCDLVLFCVKEYDLAVAAAAIVPLLREGTVIIPVLNGVDIAERLRALLPSGIVLNGCVYISAFVAAPGVVRQVGGSCQIIFGPDAGGVEPYRPLEQLFTEARIKAELSAESAVHLWTKYLFVSPLAGVTSLTGKTFGEVMADPKDRGMVLGLMTEIANLARAKGVPLPADCIAGALARVAGFPPQAKSSLQLDHEKGARTELELFIGYAVRAGRALGVPVPVHEALYAALH